MDLGTAFASPHDHVVGFYETDSFLVESVVDFLSPAWRDGDPVIVVATPEHRDGFAAALTETVAARPHARGQLTAVDAAETLASFMRADLPDPVRFREVIGGMVDRATAGGRTVRIFGEMVALLWAQGNVGGAMALEDLWNELRASSPFELFCAYPMSAFHREADTAAFQQVCQQHSLVLPTESFSKLSDVDEQTRAMAILEQEAIAGINERVDLRRRQHELQDALQRTRALEHILREFMATVAYDDRAALGSQEQRRTRNTEALQKTVLRTLRRTLRATCVLVPTDSQPLGDVAVGSRDSRDSRTVTRPVAAGRVVFGQLRVQLSGGRRLDDDQLGFLDAVAGVLAAAHQHDRARRRLEVLALHDPLTGLPNRTLLFDRLAHALRQGERTNERVAVLFADLDGFKRINDTLGHLTGDQILVMAAQRMQDVLRPGDTVARFGGDEFVLLCETVRDEVDPLAMAERLLETLAAPFRIDGREVWVTTSIGVALGGSEDKAQRLLHDADVAMYRAKALGPNRCELYVDDPV